MYGTYETKKTYYITPTNQKEKKLYGHPTIKPQEILKNLIVNSTNENELVLDCFMGSGSTGVACVNTNRRFIGIELDEGYFNIARKRIKEAQNEIRQYPSGMGGGRNGEQQRRQHAEGK